MADHLCVADRVARKQEVSTSEEREGENQAAEDDDKGDVRPEGSDEVDEAEQAHEEQPEGYRYKVSCQPLPQEGRWILSLPKLALKPGVAAPETLVLASS